MNVKFDCVVGELMELCKVLRKVLIWEEVPPLATLKHNVNVAVAILVALPMPALITVVFISIVAGKAWQVPEATCWRNSADV